MMKYSTLEARSISHTIVQDEWGCRTIETPRTIVEEFTLCINRSQIWGITGKSGIGKTTVAHILAGLLRPLKGSVFLGECDIYQNSKRIRRDVRKCIRMVFQRDNAPFNPRMQVWQAIQEPLQLYHPEISKTERLEKVVDVAKKLKLLDEPKNEKMNENNNILMQLPYTLSGGQRRRAAIARATIVPPFFLILDEPTAGLDHHLKIVILDYIKWFSKEYDVGVVIISHDEFTIQYSCGTHVEKMAGIMTQ